VPQDKTAGHLPETHALGGCLLGTCRRCSSTSTACQPLVRAVRRRRPTEAPPATAARPNGVGGGGGAERSREPAARIRSCRLGPAEPADLRDVLVESDALADALMYFDCCSKSEHSKATREGIVKRLGGTVRFRWTRVEDGALVLHVWSRVAGRGRSALSLAGQRRLRQGAIAASPVALPRASEAAGDSRRGVFAARAQVAQHHCPAVTHVIASPAEAEGLVWERMWAGKDVISLDWLLQCNAETQRVPLCPQHYLAGGPAAIAADLGVEAVAVERAPAALPAEAGPPEAAAAGSAERGARKRAAGAHAAVPSLMAWRGTSGGANGSMQALTSCLACQGAAAARHATLCSAETG